MKYIKYYENIKGPEIGDYVVCNEYTKNYNDPILINFINNNIGQYIFNYEGNGPYTYVIRYKNIPDEIKKDFFVEVKLNNIVHSETPTCRIQSITHIIYWSSNKEDCELFLASKKYNI